MAQSLIEIYVEMHNVTKTKSESVEKHDGFLPSRELSFKEGICKNGTDVSHGGIAGCCICAVT